MALKLSLTTEHGIVCEQAYAVVERINYVKNGGSTITVNIYKDQAARNEQRLPMQSLVYNGILNSELELSVVAQAYLEVKKSKMINVDPMNDEEPPQLVESNILANAEDV